jgi:class 3 adenylate cyclase
MDPSPTCPACGADLRAGGRFCPGCGEPVEPQDRFCAGCGAPLTAPQPPAATPTLGPEGERKQLTVLFADVQGSMYLQEGLDPEVWAGIMGRFVGTLAEGVRRFSGTIHKFTGDGIMALFGAPVAQEDHARRACHAAIHLSQAIADYADDVRRRQGLDLHVRLGLNSGEVVVGRIGEDLGLDPTVLGHTVGLAQRMESLAEPERTYLTESTARLVEGWFRVTDLGPRRVKGVRAPIHVFRLEAAAPRGVGDEEPAHGGVLVR